MDTFCNDGKASGSEMGKKVANLERLFEARNKFACWVCNQQGEDDDEDEDEDGVPIPRGDELSQLRKETWLDEARCPPKAGSL